MSYQKTPPSEMLRVPTALIPAVRELSRLHRQGHTIALLQALEDLITTFDSSIDISLTSSNKPIKQLEERLEKLESQLSEKDESLNSKLNAIASQLEQLSRNATVAAKNNNYKPSRSNSYHSQYQPTVELGAFPAENLAKRLGLTAVTLESERKKLTTAEFISYTRNRDPRSFGWEYRQDGLYHPVEQ
jgi:TolA-binding protein